MLNDEWDALPFFVAFHSIMGGIFLYASYALRTTCEGLLCLRVVHMCSCVDVNIKSHLVSQRETVAACYLWENGITINLFSCHEQLWSGKYLKSILIVRQLLLNIYYIIFFFFFTPFRLLHPNLLWILKQKYHSI